ncbi:DUF4952 domain-containing protein [Lysobacter terrae]
MAHADETRGAYAGERAALPPAKCGDFLKQLKLGRPEIVFDKCKPVSMGNPSGNTLEATYKVKGQDIAKTEKWLNSWAHTGRLRFLCCGWETKNVEFRGRDGALYEIGMGGEAIESSREHFKDVPFLYLYVRHDIYEP